MHIYSLKTLGISILYCGQQLVLHTWVHYLQAREQTRVLCCCFASQNHYYFKAKREYKNQARRLRAQQEKPFACAVISIKIVLLFCYVNWKQLIGIRPSPTWQRSFCKVGNYSLLQVYNLQDIIHVTRWQMMCLCICVGICVHYLLLFFFYLHTRQRMQVGGKKQRALWICRGDCTLHPSFGRLFLCVLKWFEWV